MKKKLIVSPSGNFYGSEQVLCDYLDHTMNRFDVAVPNGSVFHSKLIGLPHHIIPFKSTKLLYLKVFFWLLSGKYEKIYINEAGHSRYVHLLALLFKKAKFVIHVRILEDTLPGRWTGLRKQNTVLISISDFIQERLEHPSKLIYDLYDFPDRISGKLRAGSGALNVAIIGRVTYSKGFRELVELVKELERQQKLSDFTINLYGDIIDDVKGDEGMAYLQSKSEIIFRGFVAKEEIYRQSDIVLHLSKTEPLGRIYFEAISAGIPLVGYNSGGIGEIGVKTGLQEFLVSPGPDETKALIEKMEWIKGHGFQLRPKLMNAMEDMKIIYGKKAYTRALDNILIGQDEEEDSYISL